MSNIFDKLKIYLTDENYRVIVHSKLGLYNKLTDEEYLAKLYRAHLGKDLQLVHPVTFNEKLQWLKIHDRKKEYTTMVDKYAVKEYVSSTIGEKYVIKTLGVWKCFDDIDFDLLPNQFVLKCTHDSGGLVICRDKAKLNKNKARKKINKCLKKNFYYIGREWPYYDVVPRIIAEEYMQDNTGELRDYKFFCFNGVPKIYKIDFDRFNNHRANYFDCSNDRLLHFGEKNCPPDYCRELQLPENIELMKKLACKLSENSKFLRVDFYEANGKVYFGELTFYPASGFGEFTDEAWDEKLGDWLEL